MTTKLGLVIDITAEGRARQSGFNEGVWSRSVPDVREALQRTFPCQEDLARNSRPVSGALSGSGGVVYMVNFISTGVLFTIIKVAVGGRANDNTAATLFIPNGTQINGLQTLQTINRIQEIISHPTTIDTNALSMLMAADYPVGQTPQPIVSAKNKTYAVVYYGGNSPLTLENLLGQSLYQPVYAGYQAVFFVDAAKRYDIFGTVAQIPADRIASIISVFPPKDSTFRFRAFTKDGRPFTQDIIAARGANVTIVWQLQGYAPVEKTFTVFDATSAQKAVPTPADIMVRIPRSAIQAQTPKGKPITPSSIAIGGRQFVGDYMDVSATALKNGMQLNIEAKGYNSYSEPINNAGPFRCILKRKVEETGYKIRVKDANGQEVLADIILKSHHRLSSSPLKGYNNNYGTLEYVGSGLSKLMWGVCGLLAGLLIWVIFSCVVPAVKGWFSQPNTKEITEGTTTTIDSTQKVETSPTYTETDWANACKYLDEHSIWEREKMENDFNGCLKGLFDDLNNFQEDKLKNSWAKKLKDSKEFKKIIDNYNSGAHRQYTTFTSITGKENEIYQPHYFSWVTSSKKQKPTRLTEIGVGSSQAEGNNGGASASQGGSSGGNQNKKPKNPKEPKKQSSPSGETFKF